MNSIRQIQALNKKELESGVTPAGSWHRDYDSAWIYIGGLPYELSEGDIVTIFSQFGEPVHINLVRDKETGKSKGFAFLKYEDQRSTDLAVDNLGGAKILERIIRVDHSNYKGKDGEDLGDNTNGLLQENEEDPENDGSEHEEDLKEPMMKEEIELMKLIQNHDPEDPMKEFLIQEKRDEVAALKKGQSHPHKSESRHYRDHRRHKRSHRHHKHGSDENTSRRGHHRSREDRERSRSPRRSHRRDSDDYYRKDDRS